MSIPTVITWLGEANRVTCVGCTECVLAKGCTVTSWVARGNLLSFWEGFRLLD